MQTVYKDMKFIQGYIFGKIEKDILNGFINKEKEIHSSVYVPKAWFGLRAVTDITVTLTVIQREAYKLELLDVLESYNTNQRKYKYEITIRPDKQYIKFDFHGYYVEPVKEMTIEQIEKELGYKIKVVGDKT